MLLHNTQITVVDLSQPPHPEAELAEFLSPDERQRAGRFRFPHLQQRFRTGRGMLRLLLGRACGAPPTQFCFHYSPQGKPSLPDYPAMHFNVSHSGDLWACAISHGAPVGLDIEQVRPLEDCEGIARRFFTAGECEALHRLGPEAGHDAFLRCWTRKEAYIKALGEGLSRGLATFEVACGEAEISSIRDTFSADPWFVRSFTPAAGYVGALALPGLVP